MQGITTVCKRDERLQLAALEGLKHLIQHEGLLRLLRRRVCQLETPAPSIAIDT